MAILSFATREEAWHHLNLLVAQRWGATDSARDRLDIQELACPHEVGGGAGTVIAAIPKDGVQSPDDVAAVYFGEPIPAPGPEQES